MSILALDTGATLDPPAPILLLFFFVSNRLKFLDLFSQRILLISIQREFDVFYIK